MTRSDATPSARKTELLEAAYRYALAHGLAELSLRPLAAAIGSSPRVLLYLFGSKDKLVRALLALARADELALLTRLELLDQNGSADHTGSLGAVGQALWSWLAAPEHRPLLTLWVESYARSLIDPHGAWTGFASDTVTDWLTVLEGAQPAAERDTSHAQAQRTLVLALLRGALLDLLATGDLERTTTAVQQHLELLSQAGIGFLSQAETEPPAK